MHYIAFAMSVESYERPYIEDPYFLALSSKDATLSNAFWMVWQRLVIIAIFSLKLFPLS